MQIKSVKVFAALSMIAALSVSAVFLMPQSVRGLAKSTNEDPLFNDVKDSQEKREVVLKKRAEARKAPLLRAQKRGIIIINNVISKLNRIRDRINNMKTISDGLKGRLNLAIDGRISVLEEKKAYINTAETKEDIKKAFREVKREIASTRDIVKEIVLSIHKTHLENIIRRLADVVNRIEERIESWKDDRKSAVETYILKARKELEEASDLLKDDKLQEAKKKILAAHRSLASAIKTAKGQQGGTNE